MLLSHQQSGTVMAIKYNKKKNNFHSINMKRAIYIFRKNVEDRLSKGLIVERG